MKIPFKFNKKELLKTIVIFYLKNISLYIYIYIYIYRKIQTCMLHRCYFVRFNRKLDGKLNLS
ncbi:MAG: hypothetical protein MCS20_02200, partial [Candidatus Phytoplasma mali]|nr:hypothetical protein [Candidatus Phytoplasma mali]MCZ8633026.1 hypothetical protein [Spiroplasma sp. Tabriz.8]